MWWDVGPCGEQLLELLQGQYYGDSRAVEMRCIAGYCHRFFSQLSTEERDSLCLALAARFATVSLGVGNEDGDLYDCTTVDLRTGDETDYRLDLSHRTLDWGTNLDAIAIDKMCAMFIGGMLHAEDEDVLVEAVVGLCHLAMQAHLYEAGIVDEGSLDGCAGEVLETVQEPRCALVAEESVAEASEVRVLASSSAPAVRPALATESALAALDVDDKVSGDYLANAADFTDQTSRCSNVREMIAAYEERTRLFCAPANSRRRLDWLSRLCRRYCWCRSVCRCLG